MFQKEGQKCQKVWKEQLVDQMFEKPISVKDGNENKIFGWLLPDLPNLLYHDIFPELPDDEEPEENEEDKVPDQYPNPFGFAYRVKQISVPK